jgi:hypothetical protein
LLFRTRADGRARRGALLVGAAFVLIVGVLMPATSASAAAPSAPIFRSVVPGQIDGVMTLRWDPPHSTGGTAITSYQYEVAIDGGSYSGPLTLGTGANRGARIACGATKADGHTCTFQIRANNGTPGPFSVAEGAAWSAPSPPLLVTATAGPSTGNMSLRWLPPSSNGGVNITSYDYEYQVDGAGAWSAPAQISASGAGRSGVAACGAPQSAGHGCAFRVIARNGITPLFDNSSLPTPTRLWTVPAAPSLVTAIAGLGASQATVSWRPPRTDGGLGITGYSYDVNAGSWSGPTTIPSWSTTITPTGPLYSATVACSLSLGSDTGCAYRIHAVNDVGASSPSPVRIAPLKIPGQVGSLHGATTSVALGSGDASQTVTWTAPATTGGLAITKYATAMCSTALGSSCRQSSPGWTLLPDVIPPTTTMSETCAANGRCSYMIEAISAKGTGHFALAYASPGPARALTAVPSTAVAGQVDLTWLSPVNTGTGFGNYVVFACNTADTCSSGAWTNPSSSITPWVETDLVGTATTASYDCGYPNTCEFRVGYIDSGGNIGGVSNLATASPLDAPVLTANPSTTVGAVDLSWTAPATTDTITGYQVDRDTGSGFVHVTAFGAGVTSYTDPACGAGVSCNYKVRAFYAHGTSADSTPELAIGETPLVITAPTASEFTNDTTPTFSGTAGIAPVDDSTVTIKIYAGTSATGSPVETLPTSRTDSAWTVDASALAEGTYTAQAEQVSGLSTNTSPAVTFTVDTTAPTVTLTTPADASFTGATPTISGARGTATGDLSPVTVNIYSGSTATGTPVQIVTDSGTGGSWSVLAAALADGTYTAQAAQSDSAGNHGLSGTATFTVDTIAPSVAITAPSDGGSTGLTPTISGTRGTATNDLSPVTVNVYSGATATGTPVQILTDSGTGSSWSVLATTLAAGTYTAQATQGDSAGNTGTSNTVTFTAS